MQVLSHAIKYIMCLLLNPSVYIIIMFFKRLGSRGFHNLFNKYLFFFSKHYKYCKTGA